ncbi:MAG: hypothetical protein V4726_06615 [Verrucomicrobiota bacterium]
MSAKFKDLSPEQQAAFWAQVKTWGLSESDVQPAAGSGPAGGKAFICGSALSNVATKLFTITSVQQMKELVGIPDSAFLSGRMRDRNISYPPELPPERLALAAKAPNNCWVKENLTQEEHVVLQQAWQAYLVGNSRRISERTLDMINAVHFPTVVAVAAVQDIVVNAGTVYTFGAPGDPMQVITIGTLTVEAGGAVAFASPCTLQCQQTTAEAASSVQALENDSPPGDPPATQNFTVYGLAPPPPAVPPAQPAKGQQQSASPGATGSSGGKNPTTICSTPSTTAVNGDTGYTGTAGTRGQNGVTPPAVIAYLGVVTGVYNLYSGGGNAQDGGQGGIGGVGGQGGNGAVGAGPNVCSSQAPGKGGLGGVGGVGGVPGDAAPGSASFFYYTSSVSPFSINIINKGGYGGQPGLGGGGGGGGSGGSDPAGTQGSNYNPAAYTFGSAQNGDSGNGGNPGNNAAAGSISMVPNP